MEQIRSLLSKLSSNLVGSQVSYALSYISADEQNCKLDLQLILNRQLQINYSGKLQCVLCGRLIKKTFGDGLCFPCFKNAPENSPCIIKPELCEGHLGRGRDVDWEQQNHVQPHVLYLAYTSDYKIGVTRKAQLPHRWIDQGALLAATVLELPYRQLAGLAEVAMKEFYSDKTSWQGMLKCNSAPSASDFSSVWHDLRDHLVDFSEYLVPKMDLVHLEYPGQFTPTHKISTLQLSKTKSFLGKLVAVKGQYLIFEGGQVMNIRRHSGYEVDIELC